MEDISYDGLAPLYDHWQQEMDPKAWAAFLDSLIRQFYWNSQEVKTSLGQGKDNALLVCDLGCGTGSVTLALADQGYDVIGVDHSLEMLNQAILKDQEKKILFLCQDIRRFELYGTVDVFVCLLDTINHLLYKSEVEAMIELFALYLHPKGLFIFDMGEEVHFKEQLGDNFFYQVEENCTLIWENQYDTIDQINTAEIVLFTQEKEGLYSRKDILIQERYYSFGEIAEILQKQDFEIIHQAVGFPEANSEVSPSFYFNQQRKDRRFVVARKK